MVLKAIQTGQFNPEAVKGKWKVSELKKFLEQNHKSNTELAFNLKDFYSEFYATPSKVIKHWTYYCKKHVDDLMADLKIVGYCRTFGNVLKIGFK